MSEHSTRTVNRSELAGLMGRSLPTVDSWIAAGCPVVERGGPGKPWAFCFADVAAWRIERAVADALARHQGPAGSISRVEADRRRAVALAITAEHEAADRLASVVTVADAREIVAGEYATVRAALRGVGARVARQAAALSSAPAIQGVIDDEIRETLEALCHARA